MGHWGLFFSFPFVLSLAGAVHLRKRRELGCDVRDSVHWYWDLHKGSKQQGSKVEIERSITVFESFCKVSKMEEVARISKTRFSMVPFRNHPERLRRAKIRLLVEKAGRGMLYELRFRVTDSTCLPILKYIQGREAW